MTLPYVNIHTHRPSGCGIELRTAGIHPWDADRQELASLLPQLADAQAVGEIGLDFARDTDRGRQTDLFRAQLRLARERGLPVVLHCVRAFGEVMHELGACTPRAVIFHGFIGSAQQAREALAKGYYLSFGERTFRSPRTVEALRTTPDAQLFFETDESETPIAAIYARAAEIRSATVEELQEATLQNYKRIFENG